MADSLYFRDRAAQALRLARDNNDPLFQQSLTELALDYFAQAVAIEAKPLGKDPKDD